MATVDVKNLHPDIKKALNFYNLHISQDLQNALNGKQHTPPGSLFDRINTIRNDNTGLALWSTLCESIRNYGASKLFSLNDIKDKRPPTSDYENIAKLIKQSDLTIQLNRIVSRIEEAIGNLSPEKTDKNFKSELLQNLFNEQSYANLAFNKLKRLTLLEGETNNNKPINLCDNIISVNHRQNIFDVAHIAPEGMSLVAVINTERVACTYFALIVRTDKKVYYFSDETHQSFPGQANILRTDRQSMQRQDMSVFPYELFEFETIANRFLQKKESKELTLIDKNNLHLGHIGKISQLSHQRLIPLYLLLEMINEEIKQTPSFPLLYTSKALSLPKTKNQGLVIANNETRTIEVKTTNAAQIDFETYQLKESAAGHETPNPYPISIFEKRYEKECAEFDLINESSSTIIKPLPPATISKGLMQSLTISDITIPQTNNNLFGTREEVEADHYFEMRATKAHILKAHMYEKYQREEDKRIKWYQDTLINSENALKLVAHLQQQYFEVKDEDIKFLEANPNLKGFGGHHHQQLDLKRYISYKLIKNGRYKFYSPHESLRTQIVGRKAWEDTILCPITGQKASIQIDFKPHDAFGLSQLLNIERTSLPYDLEFLGLNNHQGNAILERIDPVSNIELPMSNEHGEITFGLSTRGFNELRTRFNLPKLNKEQLSKTITSL